MQWLLPKHCNNFLTKHWPQENSLVIKEMQMLRLFSKRTIHEVKKITDPSVFDLLFQKYLKNWCKVFCRYTCVVTETALIERWRKSLDSKGYGDAVLMDLSKAFETQNHDLLTLRGLRGGRGATRPAASNILLP